MAQDLNKSKNQQTIRELLESQKKQLSLALPKHITADKMMRVALSEIYRSKALQECTAISLLQCIVIASQLGLFPDSLTGESYLVPFNNNKSRTKEAQLMIGYQGLLKLAYQSNQISNITAKVVHENDKFSYQYGLKPDLIHVPAPSDRGDVAYYYAVANLMNGGATFEVMSKDDVVNHMKKYSKASSSSAMSPWQTQFDEMAKKTLIRKIVKLLPRSTENLMRAVKIDEHAEIGIQSDFNPIDCDFTSEGTQPMPEPPQQQSKADVMSQNLGANKETSRPINSSDIKEDVARIYACQDRKELAMAYDSSFDKAKLLRDSEAMRVLTNARNDRKMQLQAQDSAQNSAQDASNDEFRNGLGE